MCQFAGSARVEVQLTRRVVLGDQGATGLEAVQYECKQGAAFFGCGELEKILVTLSYCADRQAYDCQSGHIKFTATCRLLARPRLFGWR